MRRDALYLKAYGKINLTLDILGLLPNGYHSVEMILQQVSVYDRLELRLTEEAGVRVENNRPWLPTDDRNLAVRAARAFFAYTGRERGLRIRITKFIPVAAGMAGGSADAAAVLVGLNRLLRAGLRQEELLRLGAQIGADVPFCILGGTVLARGIGEEMETLPPMPDCHILLAKPRQGVSTPQAYQKYDAAADRVRHPDTAACVQAIRAGDLAALAGRMHNVFEDALPIEAVRRLKETMLSCGALAAQMSGSGPTVFGLFDDPDKAARAREACKGKAPFVFLCRPVREI